MKPRRTNPKDLIETAAEKKVSAMGSLLAVRAITAKLHTGRAIAPALRAAHQFTTRAEIRTSFLILQKSRLHLRDCRVT
jgi:hypothetical protein